MAQAHLQPLTVADINSIYDPADVNRYNPGNTVIPQLPGGPLRENHQVDYTEFDRVFVTSDVHADFRKFVQILLQNGLLRDEGIDPYNGDDIYRPELIANATWTGGERTLFVLVGDLVDGKRTIGGTFTNPDDSRGSFEFLILALLYNLRLSARGQRSEVLFTIGNHDHHTVINMNPQQFNYYDYVSPNAHRFFGGRQDSRQAALFPFYILSPYYILSLENHGATEVAFVHGGLHTNGGGNTTATLIAIQAVINGDIRNLATAYNLVNGSQNDPLWTRYYSSSVAGTCDRAQGTGYRLIVVGHCPTNQTKRTKELKESKLRAGNTIYQHCDVGVQRTVGTDIKPETTDEIGCVMTDCEGEHTMLAFVDVAMSQGQRFPELKAFAGFQDWTPINNRDRSIQMLVLTHRDGLNDPYYGNIDSITNGVLNNLYKSAEETAANAQRGAVVPPAAGGGGGPVGAVVAMPGGYRRRKITRKKLSRKKRLHRKKTHRRR